MKKIILLGALLLAFMQSFAWGKFGHDMIVRIAKSKLDKSVTDMVDYYLKGTAWDESGCCAEENPKNKNTDYYKPWHYLVLGKDKTYVKTKEVNLISQFEVNLNVIKNRSIYPNDFVAESLKIIFHLIADMSQPLHCGYPEDKCGNLAAVKFLSRPSNLHKVWDSEILQERTIDLWTCTKMLMSLTQSEMNEIEKMDPVLWAMDSRILLAEVYNYKDGVIDKAYVDRTILMIEKQLVKSGLRLARFLTQNFGAH